MGRPPRLYIDSDPPAFIGLNDESKKGSGLKETYLLFLQIHQRNRKICELFSFMVSVGKMIAWKHHFHFIIISSKKGASIKVLACFFRFL